MGNSTSAAGPTLPVFCRLADVYCGAAAAGAAQTNRKQRPRFLMEANLIYTQQTQWKGRSDKSALLLSAHSWQESEGKEQIKGGVGGRVFASLAPFSHFETMFMERFVTAQQLSSAARVHPQSQQLCSFMAQICDSTTPGLKLFLGFYDFAVWVPFKKEQIS